MRQLPVGGLHQSALLRKRAQHVILGGVGKPRHSAEEVDASRHGCPKVEARGGRVTGTYIACKADSGRRIAGPILSVVKRQYRIAITGVDSRPGWSGNSKQQRSRAKRIRGNVFDHISVLVRY
ncbi:MAG: hypothetical protein M3Y27_11925, partial [Acidobacteriota bacterium]|nr:hypothetical protein [Acidobacteriota bacterium]